MLNECKMHDTPNQSVVQATQVTDQYTEIRAVKNRDRYGWDNPIVVVFDQGDNKNLDFVFAVVIADDLQYAMRFVEDHYGLTVEDQKFEMSHIDVHGQNGKFIFLYVTEDAPGWSVAYGMNSLAIGGYDTQAVIDSYFLP